MNLIILKKREGIKIEAPTQANYKNRLAAQD